MIANCDPDFNVLPLIRKHFLKRYADQQWIIYDLKRDYGLYYNLHKVDIVNFQFDALIERLTGRELLTMFARLRGVPESQIKEIVNIEIVRVDLTKLADKTCGTYR